MYKVSDKNNMKCHNFKIMRHILFLKMVLQQKMALFIKKGKSGINYINL